MIYTYTYIYITKKSKEYEMDLITFISNCNEQGITMYQIGKDLGLKAGTVQRWAKGSKCHMDTKRLIEDVFNVELSLDVLVKRG